MSEPANVARDAPDEAIEEALSDHHLDEVAEMLERSHAQNASLETAFSESPATSHHHSQLLSPGRVAARPGSRPPDNRSG